MIIPRESDIVKIHFPKVSPGRPAWGQLREDVEKWLNENTVARWDMRVRTVTKQDPSPEMIRRFGAAAANNMLYRTAYAEMFFEDERDEILFKTFWL